MTTLKLLSGGAAQGLMARLRERFSEQTGCAVEGTFGAVGAMRENLLAGASCDVLILTQALIAQLTASGHVLPGSARDLGPVQTGLAIQAGAPVPKVDTPDALKAALLAAVGIYFPDPIKATAGIHLMKVLQQLGIAAPLAPRLRTFPNGAAAMRAMADCPEPGLIGCTQVTEILYTPGVQLVADLPQEFELATVYTAAVCSGALEPEMAVRLVQLLSDGASEAARRECGFG